MALSTPVSIGYMVQKQLCCKIPLDSFLNKLLNCCCMPHVRLIRLQQTHVVPWSLSPSFIS